MNINFKWLCCLLIASCWWLDSAHSTTLQRIATGFSSPVFATHAPDDTQRLFVLEKNAGTIRIVNLLNNTVQPNAFLTVSNISTGSEQGLLGLAFHPQYSVNREIYVSLTNSSGDSELRRYLGTSNPNQAISGSFETLLTVPQFASNHNGGWIGFGPDGFLYLSLGDGGSGNDPEDNGQDIGTLLGSMLRIDVNGDDFPSDNERNYRIPANNPFVGVSMARPEIWAYGLRNTWRASFDRTTGDLWLADVGQVAREEVNFQLASSAGGENYGWRLREGTIATPRSGVGGARPADNVDPIYDYTRGTGEFQGFSVTGGYRYRGPVLAAQGNYFFGDFATAQIWSLQPQGSSFQNLINWTDILTPDAGAVGSIASFGEDANGNLYIVDFDGEIFKLIGEVAAPPTPNPGKSTNVAPMINLLLEEEQE